MESNKVASKVRNDALKILKQSINDEARFRDNQWEAINQLVLKKSKLVLIFDLFLIFILSIDCL